MADRSTPQIYNDFIKTAPNASKKILWRSRLVVSHIPTQKTLNFGPDEWIMSYKWEMRNPCTEDKME